MTSVSKDLDFSFPREKRLLAARDFEVVFSDTHFRASDRFLLILARKNQSPKSRLGLVIAKKHIRLAVARNRIKRLIRESFRQQQQRVPMDVVVLARKGLDQLDNVVIRQKLQQLWQRVGLIEV